MPDAAYGGAGMNAPISKRAISNLPEREQPISEQFRIVAKQWVDADSAASIMEELKTTTLEKMKQYIVDTEGPMADNRAERQAKCDPEWEAYLRGMCNHRATANRLKIQLEYLRMKFNEWQSEEASARAEMRLSK